MKFTQTNRKQEVFQQSTTLQTHQEKQALGQRAAFTCFPFLMLLFYSFLILFLSFQFLFYYVYIVYISCLHLYVLHAGAKQRDQSPWNWNSRQLRVDTQVQGIKARPCGRASEAKASLQSGLHSCRGGSITHSWLIQQPGSKRTDALFPVIIWQLKLFCFESEIFFSVLRKTSSWPGNNWGTFLTTELDSTHWSMFSVWFHLTKCELV